MKRRAYFSVSDFRHQTFVWAALVILFVSMCPVFSFAQAPTATISAIQGIALINNQAGEMGSVLNAGDTLETQADASVTLTLSDGSLVEIGGNTELDISTLEKMATGARISRMNLLWGWVRAKLSQDHQHEGSAFDIRTPNALIGVKFSQPDVEVSYDLAKAETVALAHTVALSAKNLLTDEEKIVPVGAMVIISSSGIKILAGGAMTRSLISPEGEESATETVTTENSSTTGATETGSKTGMSTTTKVVLGSGVVALTAGGVAALALSEEENSDGGETAESLSDLSGNWIFNGSCTGYGCTTAIDQSPGCMGLEMCNCCRVGGSIPVTQAGNQLSGESSFNNILNGTVEGSDVSFTITNFSLVMPLYQATDSFTGTLSGNTITGTLTGFGDVYTSGPDVPMTWDGTFTVTINK